MYPLESAILSSSCCTIARAEMQKRTATPTQSIIGTTRTSVCVILKVESTKGKSLVAVIASAIMAAEMEHV